MEEIWASNGIDRRFLCHLVLHRIEIHPTMCRYFTTSCSLTRSWLGTLASPPSSTRRVRTDGSKVRTHRRSQLDWRGGTAACSSLGGVTVAARRLASWPMTSMPAVKKRTTRKE